MEYDILIIGAGPSGCSLALHLSKTDLKIALIDKETFPRRKVCGGALSERALNQLKELNIYENLLNSISTTKSYGLRVFTPKKEILEFNFKDHSDKDNIPGLLCERSDFDNFLINEVKKCNNVNIFTDVKISDIKINKDKVYANSKDRSFVGKFIVGADGANSILRTKYPSYRKVSDIGISCHFKNVSGFHNDNLIDMYFLNETLPGYFWIFKLPGNKANVGVYTTRECVNKNKLNLKALIKQIISNHPEISVRFNNAEQIDDVKGWKLPILFKRVFDRNNLYGHRYLFIGDSASLIDPVTGEGIGNALLSGNYAATAIKEALSSGAYYRKGLEIYRNLLLKKLKYELKIHLYGRNLFKNKTILEFCFSLIKNLKLINLQISKRLYKY
ncbi:MAG: geranylgeranyl reductase family protein [Candidatus Delongbacteria bacterium]|nr:geranylgeranyl reductase family protein [Candidatus Delongbacteria bacterium]